MILRDVVTMLTIKPALQLRLVSRAFANEIPALVATSLAGHELTACVRSPYEHDLRILRCPDESLKSLYFYAMVNRKSLHIYYKCNTKTRPQAYTISDEFLDFVHQLKRIASESVRRYGHRWTYETALRALCDLVVRFFSFGLSDLSDPDGFCSDCFEYEPWPTLGQECLSIACSLGALDVVSELLEASDSDEASDGDKTSDNDESSDDEGLPFKTPTLTPSSYFFGDYFLGCPIRAAVRGNHGSHGGCEVVAYLLQHGSPIEDKGYYDEFHRPDYEWTVLSDAVRNREPAMLSYLLDQNLTFSVRPRHGSQHITTAYEAALITAALLDNWTAFSMLLDGRTHLRPHNLPVPLQREALVAACQGNSFMIAQRILFLNPRLGVNYRANKYPYGVVRTALDLHCHTPTEAASYWGNIDLVELLLRHGARPNPRGDFMCAAHLAESRGFLRCMDVLLRAGARIKHNGGHCPVTATLSTI